MGPDSATSDVEESQSCSLASAASCSGQSVLEVAEVLTVADLQQLFLQLELSPQGRATGISKGQMMQLLKGGLERAASPEAEVSCYSLLG